METKSILSQLLTRLRSVLNGAVARVHPFVLLVSCLGIWLAYLTGIYATGSFHSASRWMGAMLSCTSLITIMQMPTYRESLRPGVMRVVGTFLGALLAYIYLKLLPFSVVGMLVMVFVLEMMCMIMNIYQNGRIATITLVIIMLVSQMSPSTDPLTNCSLRFFESAVGVGVGLALRWAIERWNALRQRLLHLGANVDGGSVDMDTMPLRWGHLRAVMVASLGQLTGGALSTLVGVVLPMMQLVQSSSLTPAMQGTMASMSLVGIMVGSTVIGSLSDRQGYLRYFRLSPVIILVGAVVAIVASGVTWLMVGLFVMGVGVGGGYSLDSDYIAELMPRQWRLTMVGVAKAASAVGNVVMAFACYHILKNWTATDHWSGLFLLVALLAVVMIISSIRFAESPGYLLAHGKRERAERAVRYLLGTDVELGELATEAATTNHRSVAERRESLWSGAGLRRIIFSGVPWACEGFGVYGVGVFLPVLIMAVGLGDKGTGVGHVASSVYLSGWINIFVAAGFALGLLMLRRWRHVGQQVWGFVASVAGLALIVVAYRLHLDRWLMVAGFVLFEIAINAGPHLITFILPPQIYPIAERGEGSGIAASMGKAGAVAGVFLMPLLMRWGGVELALVVTAAVQLFGALVTAVLGGEVMPEEGRKREWRHDV